MFVRGRPLSSSSSVLFAFVQHHRIPAIMMWCERVGWGRVAMIIVGQGPCCVYLEMHVMYRNLYYIVNYRMLTSLFMLVLCAVFDFRFDSPRFDGIVLAKAMNGETVSSLCRQVRSVRMGVKRFRGIGREHDERLLTDDNVVGVALEQFVSRKSRFIPNATELQNHAKIFN